MAKGWSQAPATMAMSGPSAGCSAGASDFSTEKLKPNVGRLNPMKGFGRLLPHSPFVSRSTETQVESPAG